ncbi:serine/threonine-protein kinase [Stigmatella sp. ncwal1]|uniref:non-specific serine/threonine protein kinase n=1 Tax=Stigmatella ashevillensis TaxID=2995309 RepID=A0ABT5D3K2_9BACT|nr:serine/threonine-protein kinase [Stigmatella ashevillena]MDC0708252.1 serine/threonine-protein kinase [Stigmatella ashevillena]
MQTRRPPELNPALLPPGTAVGSWRVVAWAGGGVHGAVYQAVPLDDERASPMALKLALLPRDARFAREVELLSRVRHPHIPRLRDSGTWQHPRGTLHPYLVIDWVDGAPLYDWAQQLRPSSQQVLRLLAQLARALQALHAQGCLHRDVKGGNVLVHHSGNQALLTDFGSSRYPDAATLTPSTLPPGTPAYRSPEACLFELQFFRDPQARYAAQPTDDLYALGVTAYRLVTGEYPEFAEPTKNAAGIWHLEGIASPAPRALNPRVAPQLNALILRMLSVQPQERGTAEELAVAMEQAAKHSHPELTQSLFPQEEPVAQAPPLTPDATEPIKYPAHRWTWLPRIATAAVLLALGAWTGWIARGTSPAPTAVIGQKAGVAQGKDGVASGVGDAAATASSAASPNSATPGVLAEDTPPTPVPGQMRPDAKGRCPHKQQIALNGNCWVELEREKCEALDLPTYKGMCYMPVFSPKRPPTSTPATQP